MSVLKRSLAAGAAVLFVASAAVAQTPATTPPASQTPAAQPPAPFPEGAKIAYVNIQIIASNSSEGKSARTKIDELTKQKTAELGEKTKQVQALQTKLQQGGTVLNDSARGQLEKDIEKLNREIQFFQQDAQTEIQELTATLQGEFSDKLNPVLESIAKEKGLQILLDAPNSGVVWADGGLDLTGEVIKRFDAATPAAATKK
jgi:outer membrane protein